MFRLSILFLVAASVLVTDGLALSRRRSASPPATKGLIGYLRKEQYAEKYGCTYSIKGDSTLVIFFDENLGGGGAALMNIDGKDVQLKSAGATGHRKRPLRVGRREVLDYAAGGIKVRVIRFKGREVGSGDNYSGTVTVSKNNRSQTVRFTGWCGA
jgi:hypothetical protein